MEGSTPSGKGHALKFGDIIIIKRYNEDFYIGRNSNKVDAQVKHQIHEAEKLVIIPYDYDI